MDIKKRFAHNLIEHREKAGLTPEDLARLASIPPEQLAAIEAGEEQPDLETLVQLAGSLRFPVEDLVAGLPDPGDEFGTAGPR